MGLLSTTTRNLGLTAVGEPLTRGRSAPKGWRSAFGFLTVAAARAGLTAISLSIVYLLALTAMAMVLATSMLNTAIGAAVAAVFAALVLVFVAVGIYVVIP